MAESKKSKMFGWDHLPDKASEILGDDFWNEIGTVIPKRGPNVDVYRTNSEVIIVVEAAGIQAIDQINIGLSGNRLLVYGEIPWTYSVGEENFIQRERFIGSFRRELKLPPDVKLDSEIDARYRNGLIEVHIPRLPTQDERTINILCEE